MNDKGVFRQAMKERLARMSENDRRVESQILVRELRKLIAERNPSSIGVYIPLKDEPDLRPLIQEWLDAGKEVSMPQVQRNEMHFRKIVNLADIGRDEANIPASPNTDSIDESRLDIVLVPGRAFTKDGHRMGRGNGGYDRWIAEQRERNPDTRYIGVCFDCQLVQEMPLERHDERVGGIVTPSKIHTVSSI